MSFSKNRKRSGVILAGVTTASVAASAASQGMVSAFPQNSVTTTNVSGEAVKNASSSIVNFLKNNYGWVILATLCIAGLVWCLYSGNSVQEVTNVDYKGQENHESEIEKKDSIKTSVSTENKIYEESKKQGAENFFDLKSKNVDNKSQ